MKQKILCIGPFQKPSNANLRTLSFENLGFEVERVDVSDANVSRNIFSRIKRRITRLILRKNLNKIIAIKIQEFLPDLVFIEKGVDFNKNDLIYFRSLSEKTMKIAHLNPDDPFGDFKNGWGRFVSSIPYYDFHFVPKEINKNEYIEHGAEKVYVYDRSFSPEYHRPLNIPIEEKKYFKSSIGFIGSYAPYRESIIYSLVCDGLDVTIWGDGWENGRYWKYLSSHLKGRCQTGDNYIKAIAGMDIALHFVRHENRDLQDSRTFEIPACGAFMLAERTADHERLFIENKEAVFFDSSETCIKECKYYLSNPSFRAKIAEAGMSRVAASNYDYKSRSKEILEVIFDDHSKKNNSIPVL